MKNVCLLLTKSDGFPWNVRIPSMEIFEAAGYHFSEVRWLSIREFCDIENTVADCKAKADNLVVLSCGVSVASIARPIIAAFGCEDILGSVNGEGVFSAGDKTLFLLDAKDLPFAKEVCIPFLAKKLGVRTGDIVLRCVGVEDRRMQEILQKAENYAQGRVKILRSTRYGEDVIRIFYDENTPRMLTDDLLRYFTDVLRDNLYAMEDRTLEQQLVELLRIRRRKIAVAESFTGGGIARRIVSVSGASDVYYEGVNTYAEEAKIRRLGVSEFTLRSQGAVSEQTAYEMAAGLLEQKNCEVSIATTGLAGPNGDGSGVPVGTCCIAVGVDENVYVHRHVLSGDREEVTETAINYALFFACKQLKNM